MNQVLLGASFAFVCGALWYAARRGRASLRFLVVIPILMVAGVIWAHVPDIPRLLGNEDLYNQWARDPRMDLFFWHYSIDKTEAHAGWHTVALLGMWLTLVFAAWRELHGREREAEG